MRLAILALLLFSPFAFAGPAVIAVGVWLAANAALVTIAQIALTVALSVYGSAKQRKAARRAQAEARKRFEDSLQDRTATIVTAEAPHRYVYGRARVGSNVVALFGSGNVDQYKYLVCIHANHECDAIEKIYINGKYIGDLDGNGDVLGGPFSQPTTGTSSISFLPGGGISIQVEQHTGPAFNLNKTPNSATTLVCYHDTQTGTAPYSSNIVRTYHPYTRVGVAVTLTDGYTGTVKTAYQYTDVNSRVRVSQHLGTPGQTADVMLRAALPDKWPITATLNGLCYTVIRLDLNHPEFQGGLVPIEVLLRGKKLYDPRTTLTIWSQNNALAIRDYLISPMCGVPAEDIPDDFVITAANVCDEAQTFGPRYTINGVVTSDQNQSEVLEGMADSMAGSIVATAWQISAGKYVAPVASFAQDDIVGSVAINPGISDADMFNGIRGKFISPDNFHVVTDFTPYQNPTYVTIDGGEVWADKNYPWTDAVQRVHNLTRIETEDQRNGYTMKADFSLKAFARKINDRIIFTSALFGQTDKVFRVTDRVITPNGFIELTLKEDAASIWDFADSVLPDDTPNSNLSDPFAIDKLEGVVATSGTDDLLILSDGTVISRMRVTWAQSTNVQILLNGQIEVEWINGEVEMIQKLSVSGNATEAFLHPVEDGQDYTIRARAFNVYLNLRSDWSYATLHNVVGKTAPPSSILSFSIDDEVLSWNEVTDKDLDGYLLRYHYGNNVDWNSANALHVGVITESPYKPETLPYGVVTIMIKAIDTSENESLITANIFTNLGDPIIDNIVNEYALHPTFPGTKTNCTVVANKLVAGALDSFYGTDLQSFYGVVTADSFYEPGSYAQMVYQTGDIPISSLLMDAKTTLALIAEGQDITVEYRFSDPAPMFGADGESFYGSDSDPFYDGGPGGWLSWPGAILTTNDIYQFRVTIGAGITQGKIIEFSFIIDTPDITESIGDLVISNLGTTIPYTKSYTGILTIQATLQANSSGAETVEIDKTTYPLNPIIRAFNSSHVAVSGASADITIRGY